MRRRPAAFLVGLLLLGGCRCGPEGTDAGTDSGSAILGTYTVVPVYSSVADIDRLHVTAVMTDSGGMTPCVIGGMQYEGDIPAIVVGPLDLSCPMAPADCPVFSITWAGPDYATIAGPRFLGEMRVVGPADFDCQAVITIEAFVSGNPNPVASGMTAGFASYGLNWTGAAVELMP